MVGCGQSLRNTGMFLLNCLLYNFVSEGFVPTSQHSTLHFSNHCSVLAHPLNLLPYRICFINRSASEWHVAPPRLKSMNHDQPGRIYATARFGEIAATAVVVSPQQSRFMRLRSACIEKGRDGATPDNALLSLSVMNKFGPFQRAFSP